MSELNIYQKLLKITEAIDVVMKNMTVGIGNSQYKGVGEVDVLNAVKPAEIKYGVYSYPINREVVSAETFIGEKPGYKPTDPPKRTYKFVLRLKTTYRFVNVDKPSEYVDQVMISDGEDPMDKAPGKAATYGDKFSLLKAYKIVTGVDTDNNHSNDTTPTNMKQYKEKTSSNYKNEKEAKVIETANGLAKIMGKLNNDDNKEFRPTVISTICNERKVDKWGDITFDDKFSYKNLIDRVSAILKTEKDLANAGI